MLEYGSTFGSRLASDYPHIVFFSGLYMQYIFTVFWRVFVVLFLPDACVLELLRDLRYLVKYVTVNNVYRRYSIMSDRLKIGYHCFLPTISTAVHVAIIIYFYLGRILNIYWVIPGVMMRVLYAYIHNFWTCSYM